MIRFYAALWAGKCAKLGSVLLRKLLKKEGTNLPGQVALKICPDFIEKVKKPETVIAVTGTNGKTTLTNIIADLLTKNGYRILSNRLGSNINSGIATALLNGVSLFGREKYKTAVLEVDERSAFRVFPYIHPSYVVVTNLLRDSCRRNAHPHYIFNIINNALPDDVTLVLNADDLISSKLKENNPHVYYGIGKQPWDHTECRNLLNDMQICPVCQGLIQYEYSRYNHIGRAKCPSCGFEAPKADYLAGLMDYEKMTMPVATPAGEETYPMISDSIFNLYNEMAAIAFCRSFGIEYEPLKKSLETTHVIESRYRKVTEDGVDIVTNMAKGQIAPAVTVAFEYAASRPGEKELVIMLDDFRDAAVTVENTAYLYDVDFEFFNQPNVSRIVVQGDRSRDYLLRCLLAGIPEEKLRCVDQLSEIPDQLALKKGTSVYILHDSYQVTVKDELVEALRKKIRERAKA